MTTQPNKPADVTDETAVQAAIDSYHETAMAIKAERDALEAEVVELRTLEETTIYEMRALLREIQALAHDATDYAEDTGPHAVIDVGGHLLYEIDRLVGEPS